MRHRRVSLSLVILPLAVAALPAASPAGAAWPRDPSTNICAAPGSNQLGVPRAVSDGAGGFLVFWVDVRGADADIYAQHVLADGSVAPGWPAAGLPVGANPAGFAGFPTPLADGAGGAFVVWEETRGGNPDIYASAVNGGGYIQPGWPADGLRLSLQVPEDYEPSLAGDGAGGFIVAWTNLYSTSPADYDLYAARVGPAGALVWSRTLDTSLKVQDNPVVVADGLGGAYIVHKDNRATDYDIVARHIDSAGADTWPGLDPRRSVGAAFGDQIFPRAVADGTGGFFAGWIDRRSLSGGQIYGQRIQLDGSPAQGWSTLGNPICLATGGVGSPDLAPDGAGGFFATWIDSRFASSGSVFAQRMTGGGTPMPGWTTDGVSLCSTSGSRFDPHLVGDGSGGLIAGWTDARSGANDIYAVRLTAAGVVAPGWSANGVPVTIAAASQDGSNIMADGAGGALLAWSDFRAVPRRVFAQSIDHFGQLGDVRPALTSVRDVAGDQGGRVRLQWDRSPLDADPQYGIGNYWIWRETPLTTATRLVEQGSAAWVTTTPASTVAAPPASGAAEALAGPAGASAPRRFLRPAGGTDFAWEFLASLPANGSPKYSYVAATVSDSLPDYNPVTSFMVEARAAAGGAFWDSAPLAGYSVDNLPPATPAPFTGSYGAGVSTLAWGANQEADLAGYRLYRGFSPTFTPGAATFVAQTGATGYVDAPGIGAYYKLAAVDRHGNTSGYALLLPAGVSGVGEATPGPALALQSPAPNPTWGAATFRFTLPAAQPARLALFDVRGRLVRELATGPQPAGERQVEWDGRDALGQRVPAGFYVVRLEAGGRTLTDRVIVTR